MKLFLRLLTSFLLGAFLILLVSSFVLAQDFPQPVGYVNDFASLFSSSFRQSLEEELVAFEAETTIEIAVVTIDSLEGGSIEEDAVRLFEDWQIGKAEEDNGLLILIAKEDRKMRIEVGYGLEPIITDGRAGRIIREQMAPSFKEGDYDQGVNLAVSQVMDYIRSGESPTGAEEARDQGVESFPLLIGGAIFLLYLSSFWGRSKRFWPGGVFGGLLGGFLGLIMGVLATALWLVVSFGLFGLFLDYFLSKNYKERKKRGKPTSFFKSWGGFSGGGSSGGGFGGFGGGSSGGGGASGGW